MKLCKLLRFFNRILETCYQESDFFAESEEKKEQKFSRLRNFYPLGKSHTI